MARLSIALLGHPRVTVDGTPAAFQTNKVQALLAYLAVEADHAHSREVLTGLLWPDQPEAAARVNLRASLYRLRGAIHDREAGAFLRLTRDTVQFSLDSDHWLDVRLFQARFRACEEHDRDRPETCPACHERLVQAAEVYRGDFLAGFSLSDSAAFDDWVLLTREMLRLQALEVLARLADYHDQRGSYGLARKYALRQVEIEPWRELAYRQLMRALALSRQPNAALAQYERCREVLLAELGVGPEPETATLAAQIRAGDFDQIRREPAAASSGPPNYSLPIPSTRFVGREREMADVRRALATTHLLTLTGIGGAGKTRLALQVAADLADDFAHGVWLVDLAPVSDAARVPHAVAAALAVSDEARRPLLDTLSDYLRAKELLLVLDNCEHVIGACAQLVEQLLRVAPNLRIIVTSREALRVASETTRLVPPLQTPIPSQVNDIPISELIQYEAMRLFVDRAVSVQSDFAITLANASLVAHICDRLDGIPLAIELAAARVNALSVEQIVARLDECLRRLPSNSRIAPPRHNTLRRLLDWSYDSLSASEQAVLNRLSIFRGGCTREAAQSVCAGRPVEATQVLVVLAQLAEKSLVLVDKSRARPALSLSDGPRYRMLETVRQYSQDKLAASGEAAGLRRMHCGCFSKLAEEAERQLRGPAQQEWLAQLEAEHDNLYAALEWSLSAEPATALRLVGALGRFWNMRDYFAEGREVLGRALQGGSAAPKAWQAKAQRWLGSLVGRQGNTEWAIRLETDSLATCREMGDQDGIAESLNYLGLFAWHRGDYPAARGFYEECLAIWQALGDKQSIAAALNSLGLVACAQDDHAAAQGFFAASLASQRELGDRRGMVDCLEGLARVASGQGHAGRATRLFAAVEALREGDDGRLVGVQRADYGRDVAAARTQLGEEAFNAAWAHGRTLTLDQAMAYALTDTD